MVDNLRNFRPGQLVVAGERIFKIAKASGLKRERPWGTVGFTIDKVTVRSVPPAFTGGELAVDHYGEYHLCQFAYGDQEAYHEWVNRGNWNIDAPLAAVGEADPVIQLIPSKMLKHHKFTKTDLITYVVAVHGPLGRDDIMRMVAALEGLPWIPTSNSDYFGTTKSNSLVGTILLDAGKRGNRKVYTLSDEGKERANRVLKVVGEAPALAAK